MAYYVRIESTREFRRNILESSKKVIRCLRDYRKVIVIRERKKRLMQELQTDLKEITMLAQQIDSILPEKQLREEAMRKIKAKKKASIQEPTKEEVREESPEPNVKIVEMPDPEPEKESADEPSQEVPVPEPPKPRTEEEKLSDALSKIEKKLDTLK